VTGSPAAFEAIAGRRSTQLVTLNATGILHESRCCDSLNILSVLGSCRPYALDLEQMRFERNELEVLAGQNIKTGSESEA
jgi:hypothetical protein